MAQMNAERWLFVISVAYAPKSNPAYTIGCPSVRRKSPSRASPAERARRLIAASSLGVQRADSVTSALRR